MSLTETLATVLDHDGDLPATIARLQALLPGLSDPASPEELIALLRILHAVGRRDLPLGRLFEGHVDALQIISRYAGEGTRQAALENARGGASFGVWNAELVGEPLRLERGRLNGGKSFASGAGLLSHALVAADSAEGRQLILIDLERAPPQIDRGWWNTVGMRRSQTHIVRWADVAIEEGDLIGKPGDYVREPWFSGGALRFVAVQAGGIAALFDHVRDHLVKAGRASDPHQAARLADLFNLAELSGAAVRGAARRWFREGDALRLSRVAAARIQVADLGERALAVAQQAVGVQGLFESHPLSAAITDLMVYLRQPAPDAQRMLVARAAAEGLLVPGL